MSQPDYAVVPASFDHPPCLASFIAADGTTAKPIFFPYVAAAASGTQPQFSGGATMLDCAANSSDSIARDFRLWHCYSLQTQTNCGVLSTTANTLVRTVGSFITDGFRVGQQVMLFAPIGQAPNASIDGIPGTITAVAALALTVNGTPFAVSAGLAAGTLIAVCNPLYTFTVAANSGNTAAITNTPVLANPLDRSQLTQEGKLSASSFWAAQPLAAVSALPALISFDTDVARY
jgi:hypothetical protein